MKDKQILVFNFIFDLLWTGSSSPVCSVVLLGSRKLKYIEKHWFKDIKTSNLLANYSVDTGDKTTAA
jgi:hypothetical protein